MNKPGFAFHCHHDILCEYVYDYDERVQVIKKHKPEGEQELRLRLFKMIPDDRVPNKLFKAREAYDKARKAYDKAREAYDKARKAYDKAGKAYGKAGEAYGKAGEACDKAGEACRKELEQLHTELCPDCPWDGETIFGGK